MVTMSSAKEDICCYKCTDVTLKFHSRKIEAPDNDRRVETSCVKIVNLCFTNKYILNQQTQGPSGTTY